MCATACRDPFAHFVDEVFDLACGHQVEVYRCGCTCDDHKHESCDSRTVAELEETDARASN